MIGIFLKVGKEKCWLFQAYAPINDAKVEDREAFWMATRDELEKRRRSGKIILMGDLNGRVGSWPEDWGIVGRYGENVINKNGKSCLELCRGSGLLVMNGWFPHRKAHRMTYVQRGRQQSDREAILDYFCVDKELKPAVVDVKVKRGVEIGSYHHLLMLRLDQGRLGHEQQRWRRRKWRL